MRIFVCPAKLFAQKALARRFDALAPVLQPLIPAHLFLPPMRGKLHEEAQLIMSKFIREIMAAVVMAALVSTGALAQGKGKGGDKRPPKPPVKIIDGKGGGKPPQPQPKPPKDDDRGKKKP